MGKEEKTSAEDKKKLMERERKTDMWGKKKRHLLKRHRN